MTNRAATVLSFVVIGLFLSALWSCGSGSGSPTKPDPDPEPDPDPPLSHAWTAGVVGLPPADSAVLDSAAARYRGLRLAGDAATARSSLVTALKGGWEGVADAAITADGTTIQMKFSDGVMAIITTDEVFQTPFGGESAGGTLAGRASGELKGDVVGSNAGVPAYSPLMDAGCANALVPRSSRVNIVVPAVRTVRDADQVAEHYEDHLVELGWNRADIETRPSDQAAAAPLTPEDLFKQGGAATTVIIAQSALVHLGAAAPSSGTEVAFAVQAFDGGAQAAYEGRVTPERWARYEQWQKEGKLIHGRAWSESAQTLVDQVFVREDLLAEEIELADHATVHLISPRSGRQSNLEGLVKTGGAASATGWDGFVKPWEAEASLVRLTDNMAGRLERPQPQSEAVSLLHDQGMATFSHAGETSNLVVETASDDPLFLPAQIDFDAPFNCLEAGTVYYDVEVTYPDCPGLNQSFDFFPGGEHSIEGLCPVGAEISYQAKGADGTVLGAGIYDLELAGGGNDVDLCPCQGTVAVDFSDIPFVPGVDAGAQLYVRVDYADADIPARSSTKDVSALGTLGGWEAIPGQASVAHTLIDGEGKVLAYAPAEEFDLRCDDTATSGLCFGWLELTADQIPPGTSSMVVSGTSDHSWIEPSQVTLMPGGQADLGGLLVGDNVHVAAEARSAAGEVLSVLEFDRVIECGPNEVTLNFPTYGLVLFTEFTPAPASGIYGPLVSGLVRAWQEGDTLVPTGKALAGVEVHLRTDRGGFRIGLNPAEPQVTKTTNEWGWVSTYLVSSSLGTATVSAYADEPELEADPVTVEFKTPVKVMIDDSGDRHDSISYADTARYIHQYCVIYQKWNNGRLISEDSYPGRGPLLYGYTGHHVVGDEVRFVWKPGTGCTADPDYSQPFISGAHLHYFFGEDYDHQVTNLITGQKNPLTQTVDYTTTLTNPLGPPPSPFDLSAPEKLLQSGARDGPPNRVRDLRR